MSLRRNRWRRGVTSSVCGYLRDLLIAFLPVRRIPRVLRIVLLGVDPKFVFLVHPRRKEDIYIAWPFAWPFRLLLRRYFYSWLRHLPPTILDVVKTPSGVNGVIVSSTWLPDALIHNRKASLKEARKCIRFAVKLSRKGASLGLGEWWPFLTKRGEAVQKYAKDRGMQVTSGYCGTLCSLQLSANEIAKVSDLRLSELRVLILGVGKMGASIAQALVNEVGRISVFDKNRVKQERVLRELKLQRGKTVIAGLESADQIPSALVECDFCICTTSNLNKILAANELPHGTIVLDDSRPEAVPRIYDKGRGILVLEGGLLKIQGVRMSYDFGFGNHEEVFGCLGETYMLACDGGKTLAPTVGDVDINNFHNMLGSRERLGVEAGGFRSGSIFVDPSDIAGIVKKKHVRKELDVNE
ncbi:MAG: hypothetical protein HYT88_03680 [Candidatus Omnitrophica bacterium]|nr:hypothetical protein [Candidatus Omnitrophota bacterium]